MGLIYDGYDFHHLLHVEQIKRPLMAETINSLEDNNGGDGQFYMGNRLGAKTIEVDVRMLAPVTGFRNQRHKLETIRRNLTAALRRREPCKLVLEDAPDLYEMAVLDGAVDLEKLWYSKSTTLSWLCPSPASYGQTRFKQSNGGVVHTRVVGTYPASPILTIQADKPFSVRFDDAYFPILEVKGKNPVILDTLHHTVTQDGEPLFYSVLADFPAWDPGDHSIACEFPYEVEWVERWL